MRKRTSSGYIDVLPIFALILIFGWATWERFRLPLTPFADDDVWAYLRPALDAFLGQPLREWFGQCFLYPWFLYVILLIACTFKAVAVLQSLLGLGTGALLFACWIEVRRFLPAPRVPAWLFQLFGAELVAVYLFSTAMVEFEHSLRPEAIFPFVVSLQIYCNLRFIRRRFLESQAGRSILSGSAAIFLTIAAVLLKPSFAVAVPFANLPVIISLFRPGESVRSKSLLIGLPVAAAMLLLIWPEWTLRQRDPDGSAFLAGSRFSIHADLVNKQLAEDISRNAITPYSPKFLASVNTALTEALHESRVRAKYWPALGFNPDYLRYGTDGKHSFMRELADCLGGEKQSAEFCRYYYWRAMRGQSGGMLAKIGRELGVFYRIGHCSAYSGQLELDVGEEYGRTARVIATDARTPKCPPFATFLASAQELRNSAQQIGPYLLTRWISGFLSVTHFLWYLWAIGLLLAAWKVQSLRVFAGLAAPLLLFLYTYNFGTVLTLAIGHSLDVVRYSQYQLAYTLLPDFASMWLALEAFLFARANNSRGETPN